MRQIKRTFIRTLGIVISMVLLLAITTTVFADDGVDGGTSPTIVYSGTWGDLSWTIDEDGLLTISGDGAMDDFRFGSNEAWKKYRSYIESIKIKNGVTSIGTYAFYGCDNLTSIDISENVKSIGFEAFFDCTYLEEIKYNAKSADDSTQGRNLFCAAGTLGNGITVTIGDNVERIPAYLFQDSLKQPNITKVIIGANVTEIGPYAFSTCNYLTSVSMSERVTTIGAHAYDGCSSLTEIEIPENVTSIGNCAFYRCRSLGKVRYNAETVVDSQITNAFYCAGTAENGIHIIFGENVKVIPDGIFSNATIKDVVFQGDAPKVRTDSFNGTSVKAYYPYGNSTWISDARNYRYGNGYFTWNAYSSENIASASCSISKADYVAGDSLDTSGLIMVVNYPSGCSETYDYTSGHLELGVYDMSQPGYQTIEVIGTNIVGKTFSADFDIYVHGTEEELLDAGDYPESSHDYESNLDKSYEYSVPDAVSLKVTFSNLTFVETYFDYIYVNGVEYTGDTLSGKTLDIQGNRLIIRLVSDESRSAYGFSIDSIVATYKIHEYSVNKVVNPTCTEDGYTLYECPCGAIRKEDIIPANGHTTAHIVAKDATCTEDGNSEYWSCSECHKYFSDEAGENEIAKDSWIIKSQGHLWNDDYTILEESTFLEEGLKCIQCSECGETKDGSYVAVPKKTIANGWASEDGLWLYFVNNFAQTGWVKVGYTWYYMDEDGIMQTGHITVDGTNYYLSDSGAMLTGWIPHSEGNWYYANSNGSLYTGWFASGNKWYYMDSDGLMLTGYQTVGSKMYFFADSGAMLTGWIADGENWYYAASSGALQTGWLASGNKWYYMDADGVMQTGWLTIGGTKYYLSDSGAMLTGWIPVDGEWYYAASSGAIQKGWVKVGYTWYYMDEDGIMQTGWLEIGDSKYYLSDSGAMLTGWIKDAGQWYYAASSGAIQKGWVKDSGKWYYMDEDGIMMTGWITVGDKDYYLESNGAWNPAAVR
ncbi:MAG: leucine-rich repeat protein [Lachnospiraceae bacterium]|nr:leucine-rich repeat protein [Lachnospiraceae bacterium]